MLQVVDESSKYDIWVNEYEYDQLRGILSWKNVPKSAKTKPNDKILKKVVWGPSRLKLTYYYIVQFMWL